VCGYKTNPVLNLIIGWGDWSQPGFIVTDVP